MNSSSENLISYEISSDQEGDDDDHQKDDSSTNEGGGGTTKRSYECTFCKRGFTNAQALGGHMNIHRKDRAKAKQVLTPNTTSSSSVFPNIPNQFTNDESMIMGAFPFASSDQPNIRNHHHHPVSEESQRNFDMYRYSSHQLAPAPAHAFSYDPFHNPIVRSSWPMHLNQELRGANLSLRIGPSHDVGHNTHDHQIRTTTQNENEVDLELRLGHDP